MVRCDGDHDRRLEALATCIKKLPAQRELLDRRYRHNESVDGIAERLLKSPNVVSVSLYRLRRALLACIESRLAVSEGCYGMNEQNDGIQSLVDCVIDGRCDEAQLHHWGSWCEIIIQF